MDTGQTIRILPIHPALAQFEPRRDAGALPRDVTIAIDYMRRNMARRIALSDLAQAAGTPERTMHKHFVRFVGIAPLGFLRRLRLAAAREALLTRSDSVTGIATSHGFSHFGRFAADYRRCFGETPSATRRRAAQPALPNPIVIPTLVLAPFRTSGDRESNNLAETIVEQLAAELAQGRAVSVRLARPGTHRPEGRYCLAGSVTRSAERARVILRLLDI
jgi:AraC-like DNA-binding protein